MTYKHKLNRFNFLVQVSGRSADPTLSLATDLSKRRLVCVAGGISESEPLV